IARNPLPSPFLGSRFRPVNCSELRLGRGAESGSSKSTSRGRQTILQVPDQSAPIVLNRQKRHTQVDADHNRRRPISLNVESVHKPIVTPEGTLVLFVKSMGRGNGQLGRKRDRTDRTGRRYRSVVRIPQDTIGHIAARSIAGVETPEALRVGPALASMVDAILPMYLHRVGRGNPIIEPELIALIAKIKIPIRHLMNE